MKNEILEKQVSALKQEIEQLKKTHSDQVFKLSNTIVDIVERLAILELGQKEHPGSDNNLTENPGEATAAIESKKKAAEIIPTEVFKCDQCDFESNKLITINKHTNTKYAKEVAESEIEVKTCSLCEDKFLSDHELKRHIEEHIEKIETLDISSLTNGLDLFECNLCRFESGYGDSIREHLIEHVNY